MVRPGTSKNIDGFVVGMAAADDCLEAAVKRIPAVAGHIHLVQTFESDWQAGSPSPMSS